MMAGLAIDPTQLCQAFFVFVTVAAIGASAIPNLQQLVSYGPRNIPVSESAVPSLGVKCGNLTALDKLAKLQVPHTWFTHFYMVSVASSAFWAYQLATAGVVFRLLDSRYATDGQGGMTMNQILITWVVMAFHGARRLYESVRLLKPSAARMPLTSYALAIAFYLAVGISVWVEGLPAILHNSQISKHIALSKPSAKTFVAIPLFLVASGFQHDSHVYLASLKKYTLPERSLFRWIICPHYTCECAIYLALAIVAAPQGQLLNKTISTALMFTIVNLAITANSTKTWYAKNFGAENIKNRSRMIPYIY